MNKESNLRSKKGSEMSGGRDVANREITNRFFFYLQRKKEANSREKMN